MSITLINGGRYLIHIMWWPDDVKATYKDGYFVPDGYENDPQRRYELKFVDVLEELPKQ